MPTYKITAPDGTVYRVTGDGTAEEALAQVQAQLDAAKQNDEPPKKESVSDQLLRGTGLAARVGINAVTAVPAMLADAATGIANLAMPEGKKFKLQGPALNELLTRLGLPAPRNATERVATEGADARWCCIRKSSIERSSAAFAIGRGSDQASGGWWL